MGLSQGYGPIDIDVAERVILSALDAGITMFDTAQSYGAGDNERLLGRVLSDHRGQVQIATKVGITRGESGVRLDAHPDRIRQHCDASLARLGTDTIDLYYLHRADPRVPIADSIGAMGDLVTAGKVRHIGLSEVTIDDLRTAAHTHPIVALQLEWSLLWRRPESDVIPEARRLGIGIVPYSPLGRGLLTDTLDVDDIDGSDFRRNDPRFHGANLFANMAQVRSLARMAAGLGVTPGQLALAWLLAQAPDVVPIPGTRDPARVAENAAAADITLSPAELQQLSDALPSTRWSGDRRSFAVPTVTRE